MKLEVTTESVKRLVAHKIDVDVLNGLLNHRNNKGAPIGSL